MCADMQDDRHPDWAIRQCQNKCQSPQCGMNACISKRQMFVWDPGSFLCTVQACLPLLVQNIAVIRKQKVSNTDLVTVA